MRAIILGMMVLMLAGCGIPDARRISAMNAEEIKGVSDWRLCNIYIDSRVADEERRRRQPRCTNSADNPATWYLLDRATQPQQPTPGTQMITCRRVPGAGNTTQCQAW